MGTAMSCSDEGSLCDSRSQPQSRAQCGFGINFKVDSIENLVVVSLIPHGPAESCGRILPGDVLSGVDGTNVYGMSAQSTQYRLLGPAGSQAVLSFRRGNMPDLVKVTLKRAKMGHVGRIARSPNEPTPKETDGADLSEKIDQSAIKELSISLSPRSQSGSHMQKSPRPRAAAGNSSESHPSPRAATSFLQPARGQIASHDVKLEQCSPPSDRRAQVHQTLPDVIERAQTAAMHEGGVFFCASVLDGTRATGSMLYHKADPNAMPMSPTLSSLDSKGAVGIQPQAASQIRPNQSHIIQWSDAIVLDTVFPMDNNMTNALGHLGVPLHGQNVSVLVSVKLTGLDEKLCGQVLVAAVPREGGIEYNVQLQDAGGRLMHSERGDPSLIRIHVSYAQRANDELVR